MPGASGKNPHVGIPPPQPSGPAPSQPQACCPAQLTRPLRGWAVTLQPPLRGRAATLQPPFPAPRRAWPLRDEPTAFGSWVQPPHIPKSADCKRSSFKFPGLNSILSLKRGKERKKEKKKRPVIVTANKQKKSVSST